VIPIVISVALVCFLLVHITPGDPLVAILPADASQLRISVLLFSSAAQAQCAYFYVRNSS
jgi:ABC-type dipeptide/oligopeptide/nickel transport system permease component